MKVLPMPVASVSRIPFNNLSLCVDILWNRNWNQVQHFLIQLRLGCAGNVFVQLDASQVEFDKSLCRHVLKLQNMGMIVYPVLPSYRECYGS